MVHHDIKPDNITIDKKAHQLTLVDLSSAEYIPEESSFIISRSEERRVGKECRN